MFKLTNYSGKFCEWEYENVFISLFEQNGWQYVSGSSIKREKIDEVIIKEDLEDFLSLNKNLSREDIEKICNQIYYLNGITDFSKLHIFYNLVSNGIQFTTRNKVSEIINLIDFKNINNNTFKIVNQLTIEYINSGSKQTRRPDVILYVNGLPLCIIELKNPSDESTTIHDAWEQINIRYWRDIPHLLRYCPLACISDGVNTKLGTVKTPYEHFYSWRRINNEDKISTSSFNQLETIIKGVFQPSRFLEILRDYIYFQDKEYDFEQKNSLSLSSIFCD